VGAVAPRRRSRRTARTAGGWPPAPSVPLPPPGGDRPARLRRTPEAGPPRGSPTVSTGVAPTSRRAALARVPRRAGPLASRRAAPPARSRPPRGSARRARTGPTRRPTGGPAALPPPRPRVPAPGRRAAAGPLAFPRRAGGPGTRPEIVARGRRPER